MKKTNKLLILLLTGLFTQGAYAQIKVGDNPTSINTNSVLELESTNKGLLLPRIALTSTTSASPLSAHVAGMKVYNTATAGTAPNDVTPGMYYNDGGKWVRVSPAAQVFKPAKNVFVNVADPNSATLWGEVRYLNYDIVSAGCITNPSFVDDPTLATNSAYLYIGQSTCDEDGDGAEYSYWIYDGTNYVPFETPQTTAWYLENTTADAGGNKDGLIKRPGSIFVGTGGMAGKNVKVYGFMRTDVDAGVQSTSNDVLYGTISAIDNRSANPRSALYSNYTWNYNRSTGAVSNQYGSYTNMRNFGGDISIMKGHYIYTLNDATATGNVGSIYNLDVSTIHSAPGTVTNFRAINSSAIINAGAGATTTIYGIFSALTNNSTSGAGTTFVGAQFSASNQSTAAGTISNQKGFYAANTLNTTQANVTNNYGGHILHQVSANFGGVITNNYGFRVQNAMASTATGTITNQYGLYIDNFANRVTGQHWSIFSNGTQHSSFGGSLRIGGSETTGQNMIYGLNGRLNLGALRSSGNVYLAHGMKADPANANLYLSGINANVARTAVELASGTIRFIGQNAAESVAVDGAITAPVEVMRVNTLTERVGIGNTSPDMKLSVTESGATNFIARFQNSSTTSTNPYSTIRLGTTATASGLGYADLVVGGTTKNVFGISYRSSGTNLVGNTGDDNHIQFAIHNNGNVGIGTITPNSSLEVNGTFALTTATSGTANSVVLLSTGTFSTPAAASTNAGRIYIIRNTDATNNVTVNSVVDYGATTAANFTLTPSIGSIMIISNGTNWFRVQ